VLITRAEPGAHATAERVRALGHTPHLAPLLEVSRLPCDLSIAGVQALLFTSANGVRAFAAGSPDRSRPALCVGQATAAVARLAGFTDVASADADAEALGVLAARTLHPDAGPVIHFAGEAVAGDPLAELQEWGFSVARRVLYRTDPATALPAAFIALEGRIAHALFHSGRASQTFSRLPGAASAARCIRALCISEAAAEPLKSLTIMDIAVAPQPNEHALLGLLPPPEAVNA
jgi:uroporphyrinogen-III synthase